jgi:asparagine synthase (glutamine-hydrolysing)
MPGITGIISRAPMEESEIDQMIRSMVHESFYKFGKYINKKIGLYTGWVCLNQSFSDCMPVWNETKNVCLIFSGEDFRDPVEIDILKARGHQCDSENASYLSIFMRRWGLNLLKNSMAGSVVCWWTLVNKILFYSMTGTG